MDIMNGFRPGQWLNNETIPKDGDYMPFGCGPRYCLGATLAMIEKKIFLAAIMARKLDFSIIDTNLLLQRFKINRIAKNELLVLTKDTTAALGVPSGHTPYYQSGKQ